ncbi:Ig-like domain-containing protein [Plantactinospora sp. GCM10030261]|uniref:L,D-transpeptidase n=1 Tax=Plantactinospora sp. GCM10030261 TaxID=3273420 RepID=UPI00360D833A
MVARRKVVALGAGVAAGLAVAGCGRDAKPSPVSWNGAGDASATVPAQADPVTVTVTPAAEATKVSPTEPVVVTVAGGTLQEVTVTSGNQRVTGALSDERTWRSSGVLGYGKTYQVTASVRDASGATVGHTSTFTTLKPKVAEVTFQANALAALKRGGTYGIAQPVIVHFSRSVKDREAAERAMTVETSPAVEGRWRWIDGQNAHWRPAKYFTPGTKVSVQVKLHGMDLGGGVYGENAAVNYAIGPSRIAIADGKTYRMKCYIDGKLVRDIPISMGKGGTAKTATGKTVNYWTRSGVHVVLSKHSEYRMTSASYGITDPNHPEFYDDRIKLCSRITYSGEFVHMADWNIPAHGRRNTSHGCINVGPANARWFHETFQLGDVVEVRNTPRQMSLTDGIGDWTVPWSKW